MHIWLYLLAAVTSYLISGINPAIVLSNQFYHRDIRTCGSGNPGFTNFKRTFGNRWAWWVLALDLSKGIVLAASFGRLFDFILGQRQISVAFVGLFALLGHAYPVWYKFKGGKGFLVYMSVIWFIDWRAGLVAAGILVLLLLTSKYMSLSTICAMLSCPITLLFVGTDAVVIILCAASVLFITWRHKENIKRLLQGTESKFVFRLHEKTTAQKG